MTTDFGTLARSREADLEGLFQRSKAPELETLTGFEFRGWNVPFFTKLLGIQKFVKGFFPGAGDVEGYNIPIRQDGIDRPWSHKPNPENPTRFGYFVVRKVDAADRDNFYPQAVLLNYGASSRNFALRPERILRDYLVQPDPANPSLMLGKAYLALGGLRVPSNFFVLERLRKTEWAP